MQKAEANYLLCACSFLIFPHCDKSICRPGNIPCSSWEHYQLWQGNICPPQFPAIAWSFFWPAIANPCGSPCYSTVHAGSVVYIVSCFHCPILYISVCLAAGRIGSLLISKLLGRLELWDGWEKGGSLPPDRRM